MAARRRLFGGTTPTRHNVSALVAAAAIKTNSADRTGSGRAGGTRVWQRRAWDFYDTVGELHYSAGFVGSCMSRLRLLPAMIADDGTPTPVFDDAGVATHPDAEEARRALADLRAPIGGQSQLLRLLGVDLSVAGECYLLGSDTDTGERAWEVLSTEELRTKDDGRDGIARFGRFERLDGPGVGARDLPSDVHVVRLWRPHPRFTMLADAPLRAVDDILEELVLLTREVRGQALSRLAAAGLLCVPDEIDYISSDENADDASEEGDPFTRDLIRTMSAAIVDKGSASALVPFVLRAPADLIEKIKFLAFERPHDQQSIEKRQEAVQRLAQGIDLPVEIVTGHARTTFSNAWQIDESLFKTHVEPLAELAVDGLTAGYLQANMATELVVYYDAGELVTHPDRSSDAKDVHKVFAMSDSALRRYTGFTEADAPNPEEIARRVDIAASIAAKAPIASDSSGDAPAAGPVTRGDPNTPDAVAAAAEVTITRAVQRAGARLRSKTNGSPARNLLTGVSDLDVAATLGPARVRQLVDEVELFAGEFRAFSGWASRQLGRREAERVVAIAEHLAGERLYNPATPITVDVFYPATLAEVAG